jgi:hypothetical protein
MGPDLATVKTGAGFFLPGSGPGRPLYPWGDRLLFQNFIERAAGGFMPRLKTCRQEAFAYLVALGVPPADAVTAAGYRAKNTKARARELLVRPDMMTRIAALRDDKPHHERMSLAKIGKQGRDAAAGSNDEAVIEPVDAPVDLPVNVPAEDPEAALEALLRSGGGRAVDREWIVECLVENIERSLGLKPLRDRSGRTVGSYSHQGSVANKALELLGRQLGLFGEKREGKSGVFDDLSDAELGELERDLGRRIAALEGIQRRVETGEAQAPEPG